MSLIIGDAPRVFGRLHLLEQIGMISFFDAENVVAPVVVQGLDMGGIGTQGVCGDDKLEMGMILAQLGDEAFSSIAFAIIFLRAVLLHNWLRHQRNHFTKIRMDDRRSQHLMIRGDRAVAVFLVQARVTRDGRGGEIPGAIKGHQIMAVEKHHGFKRLPTLELSKDEGERRA